MAGVVFVFVREDSRDVEALAEAFDRAGYFISSGDGASDALNVVVWSRAAARSQIFRTAADRAFQTERVVVASLVTPPHRELTNGAVIADISAWDGDNDGGLAPLFDAVFDVIHPARANVIALPGPVYQDAEFAEAPLQIAHTRGPLSGKHVAWEAPIPTIVLRPVQEDVRAEEPRKLGAPAPRRDFRRLRRPSHNRAHGALAFAVIALVAGAGVAINAPANTATTPAPRAQRLDVTQQMDGGVSLTSASADAIGLADETPVESTRLFEPGQQVGHPGLEPPSARSVRRAAYARAERREPSTLSLAAAATQETQTAPIVAAERRLFGPMS